MLKPLALSFLFALSAQAGSKSSNDLYTEAALRAFQKDIAADYGSGVLPIVGFSSIQENNIDGVDIFLANSPEDITAFRYLCDSLSTGVECSFHSLQARCFYFAQIGNFSLREIADSLDKILLQEPKGYENYKIWQFKKSIFSEVDVLINGVSEKHYYACQQEETDQGLKIRCEGTTSPVGNAP